LGDFPMIKFMKPTVTELLFHNTATLIMPICLN
jgi:hypothetical protein